MTDIDKIEEAFRRYYTPALEDKLVDAVYRKIDLQGIIDREVARRVAPAVRDEVARLVGTSVKVDVAATIKGVQ